MKSLSSMLARSPVLPILTVDNEAAALPLAEALVTNGILAFEVLMRTPAAAQAAAAMQRSFPEADVGLGTLRTPDDVARACDSGVAFGVSPGLTAELAGSAKDSCLPLLAGVQTPGEVMQAAAVGLRALKLFPAGVVGGVNWLDAVAPVFPDIVFCPTGGIGPEQIPSYLTRDNCLAVGGSWVAPRTLIQAGDWGGIAVLARQAASFRQASGDRPD